jgi:hypothetical protein
LDAGIRGTISVMTALAYHTPRYDNLIALWTILDDLEELIEMSGTAPHATTDTLISARNQLATLCTPLKMGDTALQSPTREEPR